MNKRPNISALEAEATVAGGGGASETTAPLPWADRLLGRVPSLPGPQALGGDMRAQVVLWSAAAILVLLVFRAGFSSPGDIYSGWSSANQDGLGYNMYWAFWGFLMYLLVPMAIILLVFRESPARYGMRIYITKRTALIYVVMIAGMMPLLFWASSRDDFQSTYPFVKDFGASTALTVFIWESARVGRFVCLEFFYRGFLLFGLEAKLGYAAIAAATVPYGLIHYGKPFPEAMGAIAAGAILGFLALRTRTIVGGAIIHGSIAVSMDLLALWRTGVIF